MKIDLHGYRESEAIGLIETKLMDFENSHYNELEIITGNGIVLKDLTISIVKENGYRYFERNGNSGAVIVKK